MYDRYFNFSEKPFKLTYDSRFFFENEKFKQASNDLLDALQAEGCRKVVLTADAGAGKTTLLRQCTVQLADQGQWRVVHFTGTTLSLTDAIRQLAGQLGIDSQSDSVADLIEQFNRQLLNDRYSDTKTLVVIDDAHSMSDEVLQCILGMSIAAGNGEWLYSTLVVGLPPLADVVPDDELTTKIELPSLVGDEVVDYISYQLQVVGHTQQQLFTPNSIDLIERYSKGNPRPINSICDAALFIAQIEEQRIVTPEMVEKAAEHCLLKEPERVVYEYPDDEVPAATEAVAEDLANESVPAGFVQPLTLAGASERSAREVLGLRFGDVSAELSAAGIESKPMVDPAETEVAQPAPMEPPPPPVVVNKPPFAEATPTPTPEPVQWQTPEAAKSRQPIAADGTTISLSPALKATDQSPTVVEEARPELLARVDVDERLGAIRNRKKPRRRVLGFFVFLFKLLVLLAVFAALLWFKPEFFNTSQDEIKSTILNATDRAKRYLQTLPGSLQSKTSTEQSGANVTESVATPVAEEQPATVIDTMVKREPESTEQPMPVAVKPVETSTASNDQAPPPSSVMESSAEQTSTEPVVTPAVSVQATETTPAQSSEQTTVVNAETVTTAVESTVAEQSETRAAETISQPTASQPTVTTVAPADDPVLSETADDVVEQTTEVSTSVADQVAETTTAVAAPDPQVDPSDLATATASDEVPPELQVSQLQDLASEQLRAKRLTTPIGDNAYDTFQQILTIDTTNETALKGLNQIKQTYRAWAETAIRRGDNVRARAYYQRALKVDPSDEELRAVFNELSAGTQTE